MFGVNLLGVWTLRRLIKGEVSFGPNACLSTICSHLPAMQACGGGC